jgi:hypothetical protein
MQLVRFSLVLLLFGNAYAQTENEPIQGLLLPPGTSSAAPLTAGMPPQPGAPRLLGEKKKNKKEKSDPCADLDNLSVPAVGFEVGFPKCRASMYLQGVDGTVYDKHLTCAKTEDDGCFFCGFGDHDECPAGCYLTWGRHLPPGCVSSARLIGCFGSTSPGHNVEVPASAVGKFSEITDMEAWQNATAAAIKDQMDCDVEVYVSQPWEGTYGSRAYDPETQTVSGSETRDHIRAMVILGPSVVDCEGKEPCEGKKTGEGKKTVEASAAQALFSFTFGAILTAFLFA